MPGRIQFQFQLGRQSASGQHENGIKRILILADCSGQKARKDKLADRKILPVDVDNFDDLTARILPQLRIPLDDAPESEALIEIRHIDDFNPDTLFDRLPVFKALREMRKRLENPVTFNVAAEEIKRGMANSLTPSLQPAASQALPTPSETAGIQGSLFNQLLGKVSGESRPAAVLQHNTVGRLISHLVEPHLAKSADPGEQRQLLFVIDDGIAQLMRRILHHAAFQRLESVWRGIHWLITHIEDSEAVRLFLIDTSEAELTADLAAANGKVEQTAIYHILAESSIGTPGGEPWSMVVGDYAFGANMESLDLLELLGTVSAGCGGIIIGAAHANLLGCTSLAAKPDATSWAEPAPELAERWQSLRLSLPAQSIGLAFPRFMLRLPYGEKSEPIESFHFEEMPPRPPHEAYLWGNPAFACASSIACAWVQGDEQVGMMWEIGDLPYHVYDDDGVQAMKPCAEVYLNEKTANKILGNGIMPLLSVRQRNCVLLPRLQAISQPPLDLM